LTVTVFLCNFIDTDFKNPLMNRSFNMNKADLISAIAKESDIPKTQAGSALEAFCSAVTEALKTGEKVNIMGFGSFEVKTRKARVGRNPRTNEEIHIPEKKVAKFNPGKALQEEIS
jgi:DNA-binding protein HU-beta